MNKLKIFIGDKPELKNQVLDYLFALGYEWKGDKSYLETLRPDAIYAGSSDTISVHHCMTADQFEGYQSDHRTVTIEDLREMLVLQEYVPTEYAELPNPFLKEYLTPDFRLMLASSLQDGWIEVPEGADTAILWDEGEPYEVIAFYRGSNKFYSPLKKVWMSCTDWELVEIDSSRKVVWQRHPHPEPKTTTLEDSDSLLDVVYHYSASFNSARGSVSYDGVITFPGRITGIEDYRKVRAEIAKDGNVTPDQVNVHSLTIVG